VRRIRREPGYFHLGRWERPVVAGALIWLAYEFIVLLAPDRFRAAQLYAVAAMLLGVLVFGLAWLLEPRAMRIQPGAVGKEALKAEEEDSINAAPPTGEPFTDSRASQYNYSGRT
jgi:hypothetical protein